MQASRKKRIPQKESMLPCHWSNRPLIQVGLLPELNMIHSRIRKPPQISILSCLKKFGKTCWGRSHLAKGLIPDSSKRRPAAAQASLGPTPAELRAALAEQRLPDSVAFCDPVTLRLQVCK